MENIMGEKKTNPVIIDDVTYEFESMTQEQQYFVNNLIDLERKIDSANFNVAQMVVGKDAFLAKLRESLANVETAEVEVVQ
jgi:hypothetical protein